MSDAAMSSPRRGQGMMEAIIAIGIILSTVFASTTLIITTIQASRQVRQQLVAINLARESIEVVRALRESNWLADKSWETSWYVASAVGYGIEIPVLTPTSTANRWTVVGGIPDFPDADLNGARRVYLVDGFYRQAQNPAAVLPASRQATPYERLFYVSPRSDGKYDVQSEVHWQDRGKDRSVVIVEQLSNWHP